MVPKALRFTDRAWKVGHGCEDVGPVTQEAADNYVIQHAQRSEEADILERAGDPKFGDFVGRDPVDTLALEEDIAPRRLVNARNEVEACGLTRTVWPDEAK